MVLIVIVGLGKCLIVIREGELGFLGVRVGFWEGGGLGNGVFEVIVVGLCWL